VCLIDPIAPKQQATDVGEADQKREGTLNNDDIDLNNLPNENLIVKCENLGISARTAKCLQNEGIIFVGDLVLRTEVEMLRTRHLGRTSLNELKEILHKMRLHFGMELSGWPPSDLKH
jgi:DNA-directed RNA polymerase subunit alpha